LAPKEPVAALHRLGAALADHHDDHGADRLHHQLNRWIAVAGDVLDVGAELVRVPDPRHGAIVPDSQQDLASQRIRQGHKLTGEGRRQALLELQSRAFALLEKDLESVVDLQQQMLEAQAKKQTRMWLILRPRMHLMNIGVTRPRRSTRTQDRCNNAGSRRRLKPLTSLTPS
jgi:hypothetical protein